MTTYSIGQPPVDAEKLQNFQAVLNVFPDNTQKLISPKDVRDGLFTTWENIAFKPTSISASSVEYIGMDRFDVRKKVYFGKKQVDGLDVMDDAQLISDADFFFYNTKEEPQAAYDTKIMIMAGTGGFLYSPYIESKQVFSLDGPYQNLEIVNPSFVVDTNNQLSGGDINLISNNGYVGINGLKFPRYGDNVNPSNDGKYLKYIWDPSGQAYATWDTSIASIPDTVSSTGTVSITGSPILINGENINFTDLNPVPNAIGGIQKDDTFNDMPVTEVLRRLLYPYLAPSVSANFTYGFVESGDLTSFNSQVLTYTINRPGTQSLNTVTLNPPNLTNTSPALITAASVVQGLNTGTVVPNPVAYGTDVPPVSGFSTKSFTITVSDDISSPKTASPNFTVCLPWYYGTSQTLISTGVGINNLLGKTQSLNVLGLLTPILKASATNTQVTLSTAGLGSPEGLGCVYFGFPSYYGDLTKIIDQTGYDVFSFYTKYNVLIKSPNNFWNSRSYNFYIYTADAGVPTGTKIPVGAQYNFRFT